MRASDYLVLRQAREVRRRAGLRLTTIAIALGVSKTMVCHWEDGQQPRDGAAGMRYVRVIRGLQHHLEIRETYDDWDWDWEHAGYRRPGSIAGRRDERAGPGGEGCGPG
jgi:DNA-binding XRE family transcriptional regulator